jgi:hypothetical protein
VASKNEQILAQIATTLAGTAGVSTRIWRSRVEAMGRSETPALVIEPLSITYTQQTSLPTLDALLRVRVTIIVRGTVPDSLADPTMVSLHSKLMADLTLGGLAIDVQPSQTTFNLIEADQPAGLISCEYDIKYRTQVAALDATP